MIPTRLALLLAFFAATHGEPALSAAGMALAIAWEVATA